MAAIRGFLEKPDFRPAMGSFFRNGEQILEDAALRATDRAGRELIGAIRQSFAGARLGRLSGALGMISDLKKGRGVFRLPAGGFSASSLVYARSRSERTLGALESYTKGASIVPVRSRWLWMPTKEAPRLIGRNRSTPAKYIAAGSPLGPLITIKSVNGNPLLAVENVGVSAVGARRGRVRSLTKRGAPRKGDRAKVLSILFVGIPSTSRAARVDVNALAQSTRGSLPEKLQTELTKEGVRYGR